MRANISNKKKYYRNGYRDIYISKEWLKEQILSGRTKQDIAKEIRCCVKIVSNFIKKYNLIDEIKLECRSFCRICDKWYIDKDWLYQKYIIEKLSYDDIVKIIGSKSNRPIRNYLKKYGIKSRDMSECGRSRVEKIKLNITDKFLSIFDGLVISDGCIFNHKMGHNTNFKFEQTISKKELVYKVKDVFENTGIWCRIEVRKGGEHIICGKDCVVKDSIYLRTMKHPFFTEQRKRWYNDEGKKIIPRDIKFNELMLAH